MTTTYRPQPILIGQSITLEPLKALHLSGLQQAALDPKIWEFYSFDGGNPDRLALFVTQNLEKQAQGLMQSFVVVWRPTGQIIGHTSLYDFQNQHKNAEIGFSWYNSQYWRTTVNPEAKLLLLGHAFETLGLIRVHCKVWDQNKRSMAAMEKLGCYFEGYARNNMILERGIVRTSAIYSILAEEWPAVKDKLLNRLSQLAS